MGRMHVIWAIGSDTPEYRPFTAEEEAAADAHEALVNSPASYPLTARQLRLGLIRHGISLASVRAAINGIADITQRDEAQVYWEFSTTINWDHPMTQTLMGLMGIGTEAATAMWMAAKDYEA